MPLLQIQSGKHRGKTVRLREGTLVIGRGETADLRIASAEISREHCRIRVAGEAVFVSDLGSANGTFVAGNEIAGEQPLVHGQQLHVGPMAFRLIDPKQGKLESDSSAPAKPKRRRVAASVLKKPKPAPAASEDDALAWLTEDVPNPTSGEEDTNIMTSDEVRQAQEAAPVGSDSEAEVPAIPPPSADSFDTVAEEAADIFRRHHLMMQQQAQK